MYRRDLLPSFAGVNTFARAPVGDIDALTPGAVAVAGIAHDGTSGAPARGCGRARAGSGRPASTSCTISTRQAARRWFTSARAASCGCPRWDGWIDVGDLPISPMDLARTRETCPARRRGDRASPGVSGCPGWRSLRDIPPCGGRGGCRGWTHRAHSAVHPAGPRRSGPCLGPRLARRDDPSPRRSGAVEPRNVAFVGTHGYVTYPEWEFAQSTRHDRDHRRRRPRGRRPATVARALATAGAGCDAVYVSLDADVVDSGYASGTGDVMVGGLTPAEVLALMRELSVAAGRRPGRGRGRARSRPAGTVGTARSWRRLSS